MVNKQTELPKEFLSQVRETCRHYHKERIGNLPLAHVALRAALTRKARYPNGQAGRAAALRQAIDNSLAALKQLLGVNLSDLTPPLETIPAPPAQIYLALCCYIYQKSPHNPQLKINAARI